MKTAASFLSVYRYQSWHGLLCSLALAVAVYLFPTGLPATGQMALTLSVLTVALWVSNVFPVEITAILYSVLLVVFQVLPGTRAFAGYADPTPWFTFGVLVFGVAVTLSGLGKRLSLNLCRVFGAHFWGMTGALICTGMLLSFLAPSGVERVIIVYPIALGTALAIMGENARGSNVSRLSMAVAYIAGNTFGFGILTGTAVNILAQGVIFQVSGILLQWGQWFVWFFLPITLTGLLSIGILAKIFPPERTEIIGGRDHVEQELQNLGRISAKEMKTLAVLSTALLFWATDSLHGISPWAVAIMGSVAMTAPVIGCLEKQDLKKLPFDIVVFSAAAITIGVVMQDTGVGKWMGNETLGRFITPDMDVSTSSAITFLITAVLHFPLVESKTTLAGLIPVVANYFQAMGMPVLGPTLMCVMAGITFAVVPFMVLPALLMVGFGEHFSYKDASITVSVYSAVSIAVQLLCCFTWYRWVGLM